MNTQTCNRSLSVNMEFMKTKEYKHTVTKIIKKPHLLRSDLSTGDKLHTELEHSQFTLLLEFEQS